MDLTSSSFSSSSPTPSSPPLSAPHFHAHVGTMPLTANPLLDHSSSYSNSNNFDGDGHGDANNGPRSDTKSNSISSSDTEDNSDSNSSSHSLPLAPRSNHPSSSKKNNYNNNNNNNNNNLTESLLPSASPSSSSLSTLLISFIPSSFAQFNPFSPPLRSSVPPSSLLRHFIFLLLSILSLLTIGIIVIIQYINTPPSTSITTRSVIVPSQYNDQLAFSQSNSPLFHLAFGGLPLFTGCTLNSSFFHSTNTNITLPHITPALDKQLHSNFPGVNTTFGFEVFVWGSSDAYQNSLIGFISFPCANVSGDGNKNPNPNGYPLDGYYILGAVAFPSSVSIDDLVIDITRVTLSQGDFLYRETIVGPGVKGAGVSVNQYDIDGVMEFDGMGKTRVKRFSYQLNINVIQNVDLNGDITYNVNFDPSSSVASPFGYPDGVLILSINPVISVQTQFKPSVFIVIGSISGYWSAILIFFSVVDGVWEKVSRGRRKKEEERGKGEGEEESGDV